jgi:hypothetical protein
MPRVRRNRPAGPETDRQARPFRQQDFLRLLRVLLVSIHSLHISTLDSFTVGILRSFPMELGIPSAFQIMDNDSGEAKAAGRRVLGLIFDHRRVAGAAQQAFLDAFRQATFGQERRTWTEPGRLHHRLQRALLLHARRRHLGRTGHIWPGGSPWFEPQMIWPLPPPNSKPLCPRAGFTRYGAGQPHRIIDFCSGYGESSYWDALPEQDGVFQSLLDGLEDLERGQFTLSYSGRDYTSCLPVSAGCCSPCSGMSWA